MQSNIQHIPSPVLTHFVPLHFLERELSKPSVQSSCVAPTTKFFSSMLFIVFLFEIAKLSAKP